MKYSILIFILLVLSSCFRSWPTPPDSDTWLELIERESFSIFLPINWQEVHQSELVAPSQWELVLWYRAIEARAGYYNNIIILQNQNRLRETDVALMNNNINTLRLTMQSFHLIAEDDIVVSWDTKRSVIVFRGKYGPQTPEAHYIQTAVSCGEENYFITISVWPDLWDHTRYYPLLKSFRCQW